MNCLRLQRRFFYPGSTALRGPWPLLCSGSEITIRHPTLGKFLCTSDRPGAVTNTWQHTTLTRDRHRCPRRDSNPQSQQASGCRPCGHWDRHID